MKLTARNIIKIAASTIAGMGATAITTGFLNGQIEDEKLNLPKKVVFSIGAIAIGAVVGDKAEKYVIDIFDNSYSLIDALGSKDESEDENG